MAEGTEQMKGYLRFRSDPDFIERIQHVADERFGTNKSLLIRRAVEEFIVPIEVELAEREPQPAKAA